MTSAIVRTENLKNKDHLKAVFLMGNFGGSVMYYLLMDLVTDFLEEME